LRLAEECPRTRTKQRAKARSKPLSRRPLGPSENASFTRCIAGCSGFLSSALSHAAIGLAQLSCTWAQVGGDDFPGGIEPERLIDLVWTETDRLPFRRSTRS